MRVRPGFISAAARNAPRGFPDWDSARTPFTWWCQSQLAAVAQSFGYTRIDLPIVESAELYEAKSGTALGDEVFRLAPRTDQDRRPLVLRPEMTPSVMRTAVRERNTLAFPLRWWSAGPMFRAQQPQRGRQRQFWQGNLDILGPTGPGGDAEIWALTLSLFQSCGLMAPDIVLQYNSRQVLDALLTLAGVTTPTARAGVVSVLDLAPSSPTAAWSSQAAARAQACGLDMASVVAWAQWLGSQPTLERCQQSVRAGLMPRFDIAATPGGTVAEPMGPMGMLDAAVADLRAIRDLVEVQGFGDWIRWQPLLARGLDYYTGAVFEVSDRAGALRALAGGGRYDTLAEALGATSPLQATGIGFGDAVLYELLRDLDRLPSLEAAPVAVLLSDPLTPIEVRLAAAAQLRSQGVAIRVARLELGGPPLQKQLQRVRQSGALRPPCFTVEGEGTVRGPF